MQQIIFKGEKLNIKKCSYQGIKIFQIEWPDYSLDFLFQKILKNKKKVWACMTVLSAKDVNAIGEQIQKTYNLKIK